jgi:uncharacterized membrane protein
VPALLRVLEVVALAVWVGSIVFFSFVVAPSLAGALPQEMFGRAVAVVFPRYYMTGGICAAVTLLSGAAHWLTVRPRGCAPVLRLLLIAAMAATTAWAGLVVLPEARAARERMYAAAAGPDQEQAKQAFDAIHRRSVMFNGGTLLMGLASLALLVHRREP